MSGDMSGDMSIDMSISETIAKKLMYVYFDKALSGNFIMPRIEDIEKKLEDLIPFDFDENKVVFEIKKNRPGWSKERVYEEVDKAEILKEKEYKKELNEAAKTSIRKLENLVSMLKSDIESWKEKYTISQ